MAAGNKRFVRLEPPPVGAHFSAVVDTLLRKGVAPPLSGAVPKRWSYKEFDTALGHENREGKQVREWRRNNRLPADTHKIEMVLFGPDETDYRDWRIALRQSLADANRLAKARKTHSSPTFVRHEHHHASNVANESLVRPVPKSPPVYLHNCDASPKSLRAALRTSLGRIVLCGPPGAGKTALADAYATTYRSSYRSIVRIDASSRATCASDLIAFGRHLGCSDSRDSADEVLKNTLTRLSASSNDILLIFDGARNPEVLTPFLPSPFTVHIIVTSRSPRWETHAKVLPMEPWSVDQGVLYLRRRDKLGSPEPSTIALVADLGGLPAVLEFAANYCERNEIAHSEFHVRYAADPFNIFARCEPAATYPVNLAEVYSSEIATAETAAPGATSLLAVLDNLSHHAVPVALLESISTEPKHDIEAALTALAELSLISIGTQPGHGASCRVLRADRLVTRVAAKIGPTAILAKRQACTALRRTFPSRPFNLGVNILLGRLLAPHAIHVFDNLSPSDENAYDHGMLALMLGSLLVAIGRPLEATKVHRIAYDWLRKCECQSLVAFPLWFLSDALSNLGQHVRAERLLRAALQLIQSDPDQDIPELAGILLSLSKIMQSTSRPREARSVLLDVQKMLPGHIEPNHPLFLDARETRAMLDLGEGKIDVACAELTDVLAARKLDLKSESIILANTMRALAKAFVAAKRFDEAIDQMARAHDIVLRVCDPESEAIGSSWLDIAVLKLLTSASMAAGSEIILALKTLRRPSPQRLAALELGARWNLDSQRNPDSALGFAQEAITTARHLGLWNAEKRMAELAGHALRRLGRDQDAATLQKRYAN